MSTVPESGLEPSKIGRCGINIYRSLVLNAYWLGVGYALRSGLNLVMGLYHVTQNSCTIGRGPSGTQELGRSTTGNLCAGDFNEASLVV